MIQCFLLFDQKALKKCNKTYIILIYQNLLLGGTTMLEEYIEKLKPYVIKLFKDYSRGHDISHLERTMNIALYLQEKEGGDRIIIGISAFLHDVHRIMQNESGKFMKIFVEEFINEWNGVK